jgi:hypothetical protein
MSIEGVIFCWQTYNCASYQGLCMHLAGSHSDGMLLIAPCLPNADNMAELQAMRYLHDRL